MIRQSRLSLFYLVFLGLGIISTPGFAQNTFLVTNTNDLGAGTLRQAIVDANNTPNTNGLPDQIVFDLDEADQVTFADRGFWLFELNSGLPPITEGVVIDGTTAGFDQNRNFAPPILLVNQSDSEVSYGFYILSSDVTLKYMSITGFGSRNVNLVGNTFSNNVIEDMVIGFGLADFPFQINNGVGIYVDAMTNVQLRNNEISNCTQGIYIIRGGRHTIEGNLLNSNLSSGIEIRDSERNTIGTPSNGNIIIRNRGHGILVNGEASVGTVIQNNDIGMRNNGLGMQNRFDGIWISYADSTLIGGGASNTGNVIVNSGRYGINLTDVTGTIVQGNEVGYFRGTFAPNESAELRIANSSFGNLIGGTTASEENIFGKGLERGGDRIISIESTAGRGNEIQNNDFSAQNLLQIDLNSDKQTENDPGDADEGPNRFQNFPEIIRTRYNATTGDGTILYRCEYGSTSCRFSSHHPIL